MMFSILTLKHPSHCQRPISVEKGTTNAGICDVRILFRLKLAVTGRQKIQGNQYQKERLIRHTSQSGHGGGDSGPKWLAHPRPENHAEEKSSFPPPGEGATTKSLKRPKRRVAQPLAIAWPHLRASFCLNMALASEKPML